MPFHAAGVHTYGSQENAFSKVVSSYSYTPSIKALGHARSQNKRAEREWAVGDQMLIATVPSTPKEAGENRVPVNLAGVTEEKDEIVKAVSHCMRTNVPSGPSADDVLTHLEECRVAHFACHGISEAVDPSNSGLILQKLAPDGAPMQDRLSVCRISRLRLRNAQIAYLSACSRVENKATRLWDELIHILSGSQFAGFSHVMGSLWPAGDSEGGEVAKHFYSSLLGQKSQVGVKGREVALVVQKAVMAVRRADLDMPLLWAQFVHLGA